MDLIGCNDRLNRLALIELKMKKIGHLVIKMVGLSSTLRVGSTSRCEVINELI